MTLGSQETLGQATPGQAALGQETAARMTGVEALARRGIVMETAPQRSTARFPDGADFRIEIPSVEGPAVLRAVLEQAAAEGVTVNRVSQGSGAMLLSEHELAEMAALGADHGLEISLFVGPREEWDIGSLAQSDEGPSRGGLIRGSRQLRYAVDDVLRGVDCGIRGFLVADTGLLELLAGMQKDGEIPDSVVWKVSAMLAPGNPLSVAQLERLGADTVNVPSDMTLGLLAELRAATTLPIDLYVEAPSSMGGVVRGHEASELVAVASPMYVKFGLRNSRPLYPERAAPGRRGGRHRPGEGAPGPGGAGMDGPGRPGAGPVRARGTRPGRPGARAVTGPPASAGPAPRRRTPSAYGVTPGCAGTTRSRWPTGWPSPRPGSTSARTAAARSSASPTRPATSTRATSPCGTWPSRSGPASARPAGCRSSSARSRSART